jgi:hypothetical protein
MKRSKLATILKRAEIISKAIEAETEEILEDAERAVKETVPACSQVAALAAIEKRLEKEGLEVLFQKAVSKEAMAKTAAEALDEKELDKLVEKIADAVVEELEDVLKDGDEVASEEIETISEDEDEDASEIEGKLKSVLERKLASKGIYAKFERKFEKKQCDEDETEKKDTKKKKVSAALKAKIAFDKVRSKRSK